MSVGVVNKQTGDRIPTAGMPAIDDALDLTSVNPVQNDIITAALANKQNATDNSLQTTDKTVVGAVNELKSGLINVDVALSVPDGTGKNLIPMTLEALKNQSTSGTWADNVYTVNGISFTVNANTDNIVTSISASGTATGLAMIELSMNIKIGSYILNGCSAGGSAGYYVQMYKSGFIDKKDRGDGVDININSNNSVRIICAIGEGITANNLTFYPMLRLASVTDPTFSPYIPSVESRIEAVESGLTSLGNKVFSAYGTQNADSWYKIGEYVLPEPNYIIHNFIIAIAGTQIKQVTLRCTPTGFNNDLTAVRQVYSDSKNFAIRLASTSKVELYAKVGLRGRHAYSIISEAGNADYKVTLSNPVASSYTDTDMYIVN